MTTMTAQTTQVYQVFVKASPEAIWEAITKPEFTRRYFYGTALATTLEPGTAFDFHYADGSGLAVEGSVVESDPPRRLVHTWHALYTPELAAEPHSRVTWEIEPQEEGYSLLTVAHDRLESSPKTAEGVSGTGWMYVLSALKTLLETGRPLAD